MATSVQRYPDWDISRVQITPGIQSVAYRCYYGLSLTNRNYIVVILPWLASALRGDCSVSAIRASGAYAASLGKAVVSLYALNGIRADYSICEPSRPSCWPERPIACNLVANIDRRYRRRRGFKIDSKTPDSINLAFWRNQIRRGSDKAGADTNVLNSYLARRGGCKCIKRISPYSVFFSFF